MRCFEIMISAVIGVPDKLLNSNMRCFEMTIMVDKFTVRGVKQ